MGFPIPKWLGGGRAHTRPWHWSPVSLQGCGFSCSSALRIWTTGCLGALSITLTLGSHHSNRVLLSPLFIILVPLSLSWSQQFSYCSRALFFFFNILFISRERGREDKEKERNINTWLPLMPPTRDLAWNPVICLDWESNQWPLDSQASTQSPEPHQPGLRLIF